GVAALTRLIKETLTDAFPAVWVKGEVTGFRRSERGHLYFSLKDKEALLECAMYRSAAVRLGFELRDGDEVEAFGGVSVYEPRWRLDRGPVGLQRGARGARDRGIQAPRDLGRGPRGGLDARRPRGRPARRNAFERGRDRGARPSRCAEGGRAAGDACRPNGAA